MLAVVEEEGIYLKLGRGMAASLPEILFSTTTPTSIVPVDNRLDIFLNTRPLHVKDINLKKFSSIVILRSVPNSESHCI